MFQLGESRALERQRELERESLRLEFHEGKLLELEKDLEEAEIANKIRSESTHYEIYKGDISIDDEFLGENCNFVKHMQLLLNIGNQKFYICSFFEVEKNVTLIVNV